MKANVSHKAITHSADDYRPQKKEPKFQRSRNMLLIVLRS
jgi:hypothetical protein